MLIRVFLLASVDDDRLFNWSPHSPVDETIFLVVGDSPAIEMALVSMYPNVSNNPFEEALIDSVSNKVLMGPLGHGLGVGPRFFIDEAS